MRVSLAPVQWRTPCRRIQSPRLRLEQKLREWLAPTLDQVLQTTTWISQHSDVLLAEATSRWTGGVFVVTYHVPFPSRSLGADDIPAEIKRFWHTFRWNADPWIRDLRGNMILTSTYTRIADFSRVDLLCERIGPSVLVF